MADDIKSHLCFADDSDDEVYMSIANNDSATDSTLDMSTCSMSTSQTSSTTAGECQPLATHNRLIHIDGIYFSTDSSTRMLQLPVLS